MALTVALSAVTASDGTFSASGATAWLTVTGRTATVAGIASGAQGGAGADLSAGTNGGIPYFSATGVQSSSALLAANGIVVGGGAGAAPNTTGTPTWGAATGQGLVMAAGTATTDVAAMSLTRTNNNAAVATGVKWTFTDTTSAAGFLPFQILGGSSGTTNLISVDKNGAIAVPVGSVSAPSVGIRAGEATGIYSSQAAALSIALGGTRFAEFQNSGSFFLTGTNAQLTLGSSFNAGVGWGGTANQLVFAGGTALAGQATSRAEINKSVTGIADNTATATFTVTVPNAAHSASIRIRLTGSLGAGGAIGANESTQDAEYMINVARTAGVNAVATIGAVVGQAAAASVAGAANAAVTGTLSAISGVVGATNTFTINVTIARSGGSSTNHTCFAFAELLNSNASGVTIA